MGTATFGFNPVVAVPYFEVIPHSFKLLANYGEPQLGFDPQRVGLFIFYSVLPALAPSFASIGGTASPFPEFALATVQPTTFLWQDYGPLVCQNWYFRDNAGLTTLFVAEVRYDPSIR